MKKKLPKAVLWTADEMRETDPGDYQLADALHPADLNEPPLLRPATPKAKSDHKVVEMPAQPDRTTAAANVNDQPKPETPEIVRRRRQARAIVERHANMSAVGGAIPLPIANIAGVTAIIVRMVRSLSRLYGQPFDRNRTRAIVIGLMGGIMPTGLASAATSTLIYFIPGYNLVGLAVSSVTASATTRGIGQIFIDHFENGSTLVEFPSVMMR